MDVGRALLRVNEFVLLCELSTNLQDQYVSSYSTQPEWKKIDRDISNRLPIVEAIASEVDPRLASQLRAPDTVITHFNKRNASRELQGALEHQEEIEKVVNPGPQLAAAAACRGTGLAALLICTVFPNQVSSYFELSSVPYKQA